MRISVDDRIAPFGLVTVDGEQIKNAVYADTLTGVVVLNNGEALKGVVRIFIDAETPQMLVREYMP